MSIFNNFKTWQMYEIKKKNIVKPMGYLFFLKSKKINQMWYL